ncbi:DUF6480 family protein [Streptomyces zhihengii]|uniref:Uncharacterized protein n=1 Tax=Streptomyces zhihengii TaxID=1818004 RepID=A0ABS2V2H4_9ACTN|nr:DUF6480 family protein [Streptomyces zhihengii]MBM9623920.1 hypothetical protein [Streptomyces zhihengii]
MNTPSNPDPDPRTTSGLDNGGGVPPGETPPAEAGMSTSTGPRRPPRRGWGKGPLIIIWALVVVCALFFLAYAIALGTR